MYTSIPDPAVLRDAGIYTIAELSELTKVPANTLYLWMRRTWLGVVVIDRTTYSTVQAVKIAAGDAARDGRGQPRKWTLSPEAEDLDVAVV